MSGNWKSDLEITAVFWWCISTRGQNPWCYWWSISGRVSLLYWAVKTRSLPQRMCSLERWCANHKVECTQGSPWSDFLLSRFILLFWEHRKGSFFFYLPKNKVKMWPAFILFKGSLLYWELCYHTHKGVLNVSISVPLILARTSKTAPKGEMRSLESNG